MTIRTCSPLTVAVTWLLLLFMAAPLLVVLSLSFSSDLLAQFPPRGFTLSWYASVLAEPGFQSAFLTSLTLAAASTFCAMVLGAPAAIAVSRGALPGSHLIEATLLSPMMLPILIAGLSLLQFLSALGLRSAPVNLLIGHTIVTLPYVMRTVTASLKQINPSLEEAASTLGAPPLAVFLTVTIPQIAPGLLAGCLIAFMVSFDDFSMSLWLSDAGTEPLPIYLHHAMASVFDPSIAAMSSLMIVTGIVVVLILERLVGLRKAMGV